MPTPPFGQGPAPLLNRAWPRRGWASAPFFGTSVPGLMMETTITITRRVRTPDGLGGFGATTSTVIYTGPAHVEHFEEPRPVLLSGDTTVTGVVMLHHYEAFMPIPEDPAQVPQQGDHLVFNDGYTAFDLPIQHVEMNAGLTDHLEIFTDEYEAT